MAGASAQSDDDVPRRIRELTTLAARGDVPQIESAEHAQEVAKLHCASVGAQDENDDR